MDRPMRSSSRLPAQVRAYRARLLLGKGYAGHDPSLKRRNEIRAATGDPAMAARVPGWRSTVGFAGIIARMVGSEREGAAAVVKRAYRSDTLNTLSPGGLTANPVRRSDGMEISRIWGRQTLSWVRLISHSRQCALP
jgi:hypothetical protein